MNTRAKVAIVGLGVIIVGGVLLLLTHSFSKKSVKDSVVISNLGSCANNIDPSVEATLSLQLYTYVKKANDYNHTSNLDSYMGEIRKGSCKQISTNTLATNTVHTTSATLDIPQAKQSWRITWAWIPSNETLSSDLGSVTMECLATNELKYGDFHCENVLSLVKYGTANYDPILKYMPYSGDSFSMTYNPDNKAVSVTVLVPQVWASDPTVAKNIESVVPDWFTQRHLDINNYTVTYDVQTKSP